jgi:hypothetical protein
MKITNLKNTPSNRVINKMLSWCLDSGVATLAENYKMNDDEKMGAMLLAERIRNAVYNDIKAIEIRQS